MIRSSVRSLYATVAIFTLFAMSVQAAVVEPPDPATDDPLDRAIQGMRSAQDQLAGRDAARAAETQQQVVRELERLIELAQQSPPPPQDSPSAQPDPQQSRQQQGDPQPQPQPMPKPMPVPDAEPQQSDQGPGGQEKQRADESEQRSDPAELRNAELARREAMIKDVWGHLPPAVRQKLLNVSGDKYLPKYEDLARRYFEALAEQENKGTQR